MHTLQGLNPEHDYHDCSLVQTIRLGKRDDAAKLCKKR